MSGLFEHLAAVDDSALIAHRQATAVANKRVRDRFGSFLANSDTDRPARLSLVHDDITEIVNDVVAEYGGDAQKIEAAIKRSLVGVNPLGGQPPGMGDGTAMGQGAGTCPQCGGPMTNGQCATCQSGAYGGAAGAPAGAYGLTHSMPQAPSTGPIQASTTSAGGFCDSCKKWKSGPNAGCTCSGDGADNDEPGEDGTDSKESSFRVARRPKMCPYHSEVTDISLGAGDPQAGFNAMSAHAWGDKHCKGGFQGTCNFRPAMVTQKFWDDKQTEYDDRREQRELERQNVPELSIDTEPIMHAEPLPDEPGKEGVTDIDGELANAPSAVGSGELAMAASTRKEAEALKTVKLPTGNDSALGGPSPKIDKGKSGDNFGWSLDPIDTQMDGSPHRTIEQDPTDKADYNKKDFLDQTRSVTETVELDSAPNLMDDAGFAPGGEEHGPHTDTWSGKGNQAKPVTTEAFASVREGEKKHWIQDAVGLKKGTVDPDKNPLRELMEEYAGHLMPNQVEAALRTWSVGG